MLKSLTLNVSVNNFKLFQIQPKGILYITFKLHIGLEIDIAWFTTFFKCISINIICWILKKTTTC